MPQILYCTNSLDLHSGKQWQQFPRFLNRIQFRESLTEFMKSFAAAHYVHRLWTKDVFRAKEATEQLGCQQMSQGSLRCPLSCTGHTALGWASVHEVIAADMAQL